MSNNKITYLKTSKKVTKSNSKAVQRLDSFNNVTFADIVDTFNTSLKSQLFKQAVNPQRLKIVTS